MTEDIITLGIETSCDETATAILKGRAVELSSVVASQDDIHNKYGGIVPELACRRHLEVIRPAVNSAMEKAGVGIDDIDLVAVTCGPGLVGALLVGLSYAKAFAWGKGIPLALVNHLEGHIYSAIIAKPSAPMPLLALVVSGGHTELFLMEKVGRLVWLGGTRDDAAGEAFDKTARLLGLVYPGGPQIEKLSANGTDNIRVPRALANTDVIEFSFSGPKTAVRNIIENFERKGEPVPVSDICASFQKAVVDALINKTRLAIKKTNPKAIAVVGGVACNGALREAMRRLGKRVGLPVITPEPRLCSDNAVMIATAGANLYLQNPDAPEWRDYIHADAKPGWIPGR